MKNSDAKIKKSMIMSQAVLNSTICKFFSLHSSNNNNSVFSGNTINLAQCLHYQQRCHRMYEYLKKFPAGIYELKVNNKNNRTRCKICSKLTIETLERQYIVNSEHVIAGWFSWF